MMVVSVPLPAINGKAMGTTLPLLALSALKNSKPRTISNPIIKITILPATANDFTSKPRRFKNCFPKKRNRIISAPEASVACTFFISPPIFAFREMSTGADPSMSITANKVKETVMISLIARCPNSNIVLNFCKYRRIFLRGRYRRVSLT